ncbi:branched-chain amino acid transport system permease protein [Bradyrhizobium sp. LM3.2]
MTELEAGRARTLVPARNGAVLQRYRDVLIALIAFAVLASLPLFTGSKALLDFVIRCSAYGLFATSLNLLVGYTGLTSFGHGMFFGLGAYSFGLIMQKLGVPIPVAFVATLAITAVIAAVIGAICVRLKDIYFAFVTLAFQMLIHSTILSWASFTGGDQGLRGGIPRPAFLGINLANHVHLYVASCALLILGLLAMRQIAQSPFGYTLRMIRDNAARASFLGIDVWRAKLTVFVLAALFAAMGGMVMALFVSGAYPEFAYWTISGEGIFINMLGGVSTFLGPMVGTVLLLLLNDTVTRFTEYHGIVLGVVILFFALGLRKGLLDFVAEWFSHRRNAGGRGASHARDPQARKVLWRREGDQRRLSRLSRRLAHGRDRPERCGQEHLLQFDHRRAEAGFRPRSARRRRSRRPLAAGDRATRHRPRLPGREHLQIADGAGDHARRRQRRPALLGGPAQTFSVTRDP